MLKENKPMVGSRAKFVDKVATPELRGVDFTITERYQDGSYAGTLSSGALVRGIRDGDFQTVLDVCETCGASLSAGTLHICAPRACEKRVSETTGSSSDQVYAPFAISPSSELQAQAGRLLAALQRLSSQAAVLADWGERFWQVVVMEQKIYGLRPDVHKLMEANGFVGDATKTVPYNLKNLTLELKHLETQGAPRHGAGADLIRDHNAALPTPDVPNGYGYHNKLPSSLERAGPEIYRNLMSDGVSSLRNWILDYFPMNARQDNPEFEYLFSAATQADFILARAKSETELNKILASDDTVELTLRNFSAFVYFKRTKDKTGANFLKGIRIPGVAMDIGPTWLIEQASVHSKVEHQRATWNSSSRGGGADHRGGDGGRRPKGGGRGRGKKDGGDKKQN
jgi:hypothetical protein